MKTFVLAVRADGAGSRYEAFDIFTTLTDAQGRRHDEILESGIPCRTVTLAAWLRYYRRYKAVR